MGLENGPLPGEEDTPPLNPGLDGGAALLDKSVCTWQCEESACECVYSRSAHVSELL